jgi:hypothetical protein
MGDWRYITPLMFYLSKEVWLASRYCRDTTREIGGRVGPRAGEVGFREVVDLSPRPVIETRFLEFLAPSLATILTELLLLFLV